MGANESSLLCCSEKTIQSKRVKKEDRIVTVNRHYEQCGEFLKNKRQQESKQPKIQAQSPFGNIDIDKCHLYTRPDCNITQSLRHHSEYTTQADHHLECSENRYELLVDQLIDFFEEKPYLANSSNSLQDGFHSSGSLSSTIGIHSHAFERSYVESKKPSAFTIYLRREHSANMYKYHTKVSEQILNDMSSLDAFLQKVDLSLGVDCLDSKTVQSSIVLQKKDISPTTQLRVIHSIFKPQPCQERDLLFLQITKRIDSNTFVQVNQSIIVPQSDETCIEADSPLRKRKTSIRKQSISSIRQRQLITNPVEQRALLSFSGKIITFNPNTNQIILYELHSLDMKIETQHYIQKQVLVHLSKENADQIKITTSSSTNFTSN